MDQDKIICGYIKDLLEEKSIEIETGAFEPSMSLDEIISKMQNMCEVLESISGNKIHSVESHLEHMRQKSIQFNDRMFYRLFSEEAVPSYDSSKKKGKQKKILDDSFREKLSGFISPNRKLLWDDEKIAEFIDSVKNLQTIKQL